MHTPGTPPGSTPFVGRVQELELLAGVLRDASQGAARVVLLEGEAGVGKTRMLRELRAVARRSGFRICFGRGQEVPHPFLPFEPLLMEIAGEPAPDGSRLGREVSAVRRVLDRPGTEGDQPNAELEFLQLFSAVSRATVELARRQPTLIVVDDLHWADRSSLDLFAHLAFALSDAVADGRVHVALVVAHRPVEPEHPLSRVLPRVQQEPIAIALELSGLAEVEIDELIRRLGVVHPSRQLVETVSGSTQGNPLLVQEALRWLRDRNLLRERAGELVATVGAEELGLAERIAAGMGGQPGVRPECRRLLEVAAVLDAASRAELLAAVEGRPEAEVRELLSEAWQRGLLTREADGFQFSHSLIRKGLRACVDPTRRQELHARAANALRDGALAESESLLLEVAHHLVAAGPAADAASVVRDVRRAADLAFAGLAWGEACKLYEAALGAAELLPMMAAERADLHYRAGLAYDRHLDVGPATTHLEKAIAAYEEAGDLRGKAGALCALAYTRYSRSGASYGQDVDTAALEAVLAALPDSAGTLRARVAATLSDLYWTARKTHRSVEMAESALTIARTLGDDALCSRAHACLALAELQRLGIGAALEAYLAAAADARRAGDAWREGKALQRIPLVLSWQGLLARGSQVAHEACEQARGTQDWGGQSHALAALASIHVAQGELGEAVRSAREAMTMVRRSRYPWSGPTALPAAACARWLRGEWQAARDAIGMLVEPGRVFDGASPGIQLMVWLYRQLVEASAGGLDGVRAAYSGWSGDVGRAWHTDAYAVGPFCAFAETAVQLGESDLAESAEPTLVAVLERGLCFSTGWVFMVPRVLGLLASLAERWDEAEAYFERSLALARESGARAELGRTGLDYARMLLRRGGGSADRERASELLLEASTLLVALRMRPFVREAAALGETLGLSLRGEDCLEEWRPDGLSSLELEVLGEMARGHGNPAIADDLLLGQETVSQAVASIVSKTGVTGRPGAIAYALEQGLIGDGPRRTTGPANRVADDTSGYTSDARVIFLTDMEGSTSRLERLGDEGALSVMRTHNTLIRECLRAHGGLEHAHTGDGVLATFRSAGAAIHAAQRIQRELAAYNRHRPDEPIRVRIAVHAGEALREEDRFFGAAVNAVFRICDAAEAGQILGSEAIRRLSDDPELHFVDRGSFSLKGFSRRFHLYEVLW